MIQVYLAAAWPRRKEIKIIAEHLRTIGINVKADWLDSDESQKVMSLRDIRDVRDCDILIRFSDEMTRGFLPASWTSGGRMFEAGYAYGLGRPVIVVGGPQNIFDRLPNIVHVSDVEALYAYFMEMKH